MSANFGKHCKISTTDGSPTSVYSWVFISAAHITLPEACASTLLTNNPSSVSVRKKMGCHEKVWFWIRMNDKSALKDSLKKISSLCTHLVSYLLLIFPCQRPAQSHSDLTRLNHSAYAINEVIEADFKLVTSPYKYMHNINFWWKRRVSAVTCSHFRRSQRFSASFT